MPVIPLTLTISLCLVFTFVVFFLREHARGRLSGSDRDSLLPLGEETPRPQAARHRCGRPCNGRCTSARRRDNSDSHAS